MPAVSIHRTPARIITLASFTFARGRRSFENLARALEKFDPGESSIARNLLGRGEARPQSALPNASPTPAETDR